MCLNTVFMLKGMKEKLFLKKLQSLIPLKEEWDQKADERKMSESYRTACEERREIMEVGAQIDSLYDTCFYV